MTTQFVPSENDFRIAYTVHGSGPALLLVHGFGNDKSMWREHGWIDHFQSRCTVITMDARGCGESTMSHEPMDYSQRAHLSDINAVLDACGVEQCLYWGWSFGGTIGTHLAAHLDRCQAAVIAGTYFGPIFQEKRWVQDNREIGEIAKAKREGRLDEIDIPEVQRELARTNDVELYWARRYGCESWPAVEPSDLRCPALIYTGSEDGSVVEMLNEQKESIEKAGQRFYRFDGFDHFQLVSEREAVAALIEPFFAHNSQEPK